MVGKLIALVALLAASIDGYAWSEALIRTGDVAILTP